MIKYVSRKDWSIKTKVKARTKHKDNVVDLLESNQNIGKPCKTELNLTEPNFVFIKNADKTSPK